MTKKDNTIALNAFLAQAGVCSRRAAVDLIKKGRVFVNGAAVVEPGYKVLPTDIVKYKDEIIRPEKKIYILINKPKGIVTSSTDEGEKKNIMSLIKSAAKERLLPVGRLDRDTTGLLLITNDGNLSQKLVRPRTKIPKTYYVVLDRPFSVELMEKLKKGIYLDDGKAWVDKINFAKGQGKNHLIVEIHGGKNRIIKRMFSYLGFKVVGLDCTSFGGLIKKGLLVGRWRYLNDDEIDSLKNFGKK